jgi:hypothetical protein
MFRWPSCTFSAAGTCTPPQRLSPQRWLAQPGVARQALGAARQQSPPHPRVDMALSSGRERALDKF